MSDTQSLVQNQTDGYIGVAYQSVVVEINEQQAAVDPESDHYEIGKDRRPGQTCSCVDKYRRPGQPCSCVDPYEIDKDRRPGHTCSCVDHYEVDKDRRPGQPCSCVKQFCKLVANWFSVVLNVMLTLMVLYGVNRSGAVGIDAEVVGKLGNITANPNPIVHQATFQALTEDELSSSNQENIYAVFELNQTTLYNSEQVRWDKTEGSESVTPGEHDSCVEISDAGLYGVFSQITFRFGTLSQGRVGHSITVKRNETEKMIQKRNLDKPQMGADQHWFMMPSNINTVIRVGSRTKVCVNVSPASLVYKSTIDNMITVVRLTH